ncbi:LysR family transcriptional regulator substrate-binding protein [Microcoleus sp.]|uniref:LysR family transcriptional regulator substrate-binding protein n=1 Tax=Microcoleus sp. TaxID=44472 RepID=UPI00403E9FBC
MNGIAARSRFTAWEPYRGPPKFSTSSNWWCDEKLESIPHKNSTAETPQTIRIGTPQEFFTDRLLGQLPQDDRTFYTVQLGLTAELIQQLKAGKLDIVIATKKITLSDIEYELLFEENFWLVGPPNAMLRFLKKSVKQI